VLKYCLYKLSERVRHAPSSKGTIIIGEVAGGFFMMKSIHGCIEKLDAMSAGALNNGSAQEFATL